MKQVTPCLSSSVAASVAETRTSSPSSAASYGYMRSNRNDCALASSASPRESWNDECRWQSMKPGVATVLRPSMAFLPV